MALVASNYRVETHAVRPPSTRPGTRAAIGSARGDAARFAVRATSISRERRTVCRRAIADRLGQEEAKDQSADVADLSKAEGEACPLNTDMVWRALCDEAREEAQNEPALASYLFSTILAHKSLEDALAFVLANKLRSNVLLDSQLLRCSPRSIQDANLVKMAQADMQADRRSRATSTCRSSSSSKASKPCRRTGWPTRQATESQASRSCCRAEYPRSSTLTSTSATVGRGSCSTTPPASSSVKPR